MKIFVLEDNVQLSEYIKEYLVWRGAEVDIDYDPERALESLKKRFYDVLVLDINLPKMDGLEVCSHLRKAEFQWSILMLTSRTSTKDIVIWLETGADDYLAKPFDFEELYARIQALVRRVVPVKNEIIEVHGFTIDFKKREVKQWERLVQLSNNEFALLEFLVKNRGVAQDRKTLYEHVWWSFDDYYFSRTVDVHISQLRKKFWMEFISTQKGFWYMIP